MHGASIVGSHSDNFVRITNCTISEDEDSLLTSTVQLDCFFEWCCDVGPSKVSWEHLHSADGFLRILFIAIHRCLVVDLEEFVVCPEADDRKPAARWQTANEQNQ